MERLQSHVENVKSMDWHAALKGPTRLSSQVPFQYREGNRSSYPLIRLNDAESNDQEDFPENALFTTKYTLWNFIPKLLFEQFRRATSAYFLIISIVVSIPSISPFNPLTSWSGLLFILTVSAIREAYEDYLRLKADVAMNSKEYTTVKAGVGSHLKTPSYKIKVGDMVQLFKNQRSPVDMVVLATSNRDPNTGADLGVYIETAQLDGESNLKKRMCVGDATARCSIRELAQLHGVVEVEKPNHHLYHLKGNLRLQGTQAPLPISQENLVLASSVLRNTDWVVGVCVYAGPETKLGLNLKLPPSKFSRLDIKLNRYIYSLFVFKLAICFVMAGISYFFNLEQVAVALDLVPGDEPLWWVVVKNFFTYFALMNYLIPLSLIVTLDVVRFVQAAFIEWDVELQHDGQNTTAKTSNLNDDLAMVDYLFSDKTGTLTENQMKFCKVSCNGSIHDDRAGEGVLKKLVETPIKEGGGNLAEHLLLALSLAHSCQCEKNEETGEISYKSASPDEEALCYGARKNGFEFCGRTRKEIYLKKSALPSGLKFIDASDSSTSSTGTSGPPDTVCFQILAELEFSSKRQRMSILLRAPNGTVVLYIKGSDSAVQAKLSKSGNSDQLLKRTNDDITTFATQGLRTLMFGYRIIPKDECDAFLKRFSAARALIAERKQAVDSVCDSLEKDFLLIGASGIEDKLQAQVPSTISTLRKCGIKIWVITGDKQETAISVGYSAHLISSEMELVKLNATSSEDCFQKLSHYIHYLKISVSGRYGDSHDRSRPKYAIVVDGITLKHIISSHRSEFMLLVKEADTVLCNRVTPLQKADIVSMVQEHEPDAVTLSVGDGGNDVSMIQRAHIGVGIKGHEGTEAARAADFAIPKFRHLKRLMLVHGRYSLLRNTKVIYMSFYKNVMVFMCTVWFGGFSGASGQPLYGDWVMTLYNIVFTSWPVTLVGIFEQDLPPETLESNPKVYRSNKKLKFLSLLNWLAYAVLHSLIVYFLCYMTFRDSEVLRNGQTAGLRSFGVFVMTVSFFLVLIKLLIETTHWVIYTVMGTVLSVVFYFLWEVWQSMIVPQWIPHQAYVLPNIMSSWVIWNTMILAVVTCLLPDVSLKYMNRQIQPKSWYILQEKHRKRKHSAMPSASDGDTRTIPLLGVDETLSEVSVAGRPGLSSRLSLGKSTSGVGVGMSIDRSENESGYVLESSND